MEGGTHTVESEKWEGSSSRRRSGVAKDMLLQSQLHKTKLPASFLANLSFNQDAIREKQSQELRDQHTLPLLPQTVVPAPGSGLLGQPSSSGAFPHHKASLGQQMLLQAQESFLPPREGRGSFHDSPRGHHDARASSLSSTFAELDKRRLTMGRSLGSSKIVDGMNEASQSLPHWLREAFKPDQPPPPKPATVSPMITAVAQATSFLYKDCVPFLPTFVHPGPLPAPPRRAASKSRRTPAAAAGDATTELNFLMSAAESAVNPSLSSSLQQFASSFNAGFSTGPSVPPASVPSSTSSFPKRLVDFSALPSLDPPAQPSFSRPSPALEELMSLRNLSGSSLPPLAPPLNEAAQALDSSTPNLAFPAKGDRHPHPFPATKLSPPLPRRGDGHGSRRRKEAKHSAFPGYKALPGSQDSGSPTTDSPPHNRHPGHDGSGESKLPSWMVAAADVDGAKRRQQASSKASSKQDEDGNSSSETESDPRVRGAAGMDGEDDSDASSDETVSDDRTQ